MLPLPFPLLFCGFDKGHASLPRVYRSVGLSQCVFYPSNCYGLWAIRTIALLIWSSTLVKKEVKYETDSDNELKVTKVTLKNFWCTLMVIRLNLICTYSKNWLIGVLIAIAYTFLLLGWDNYVLLISIFSVSYEWYYSGLVYVNSYKFKPEFSRALPPKLIHVVK